jgi:ATP-dependent helicase/nuclease subunit A
LAARREQRPRAHPAPAWAEANDALDEFLELALSYEKKAPASLQGFMAWLRAADTEVKRDMEISRDEVRVMTVHGAKGLEAPVVIMADTTTSPSDTQRLRLIQLPQEIEARSWSGPDARPTIRVAWPTRATLCWRRPSTNIAACSMSR